MTQLRTDRLVLCPPTHEDIPALVHACADPDIARFTAIPSPYNADDARYFVDTLVAEVQGQGLPVFLITLPAGDIVGAIDLHARLGASAELGYWCARDFRGQGYLTEAARAVVRHGFDVVGLSHIHIRVQPENTASLALARRLGFTMHDVVPGSVLIKGELRDAWLGTLRAEDFAGGAAPQPRTVHERVLEFHRVYGAVIGTGMPRVDHPDMAMRLRLIAEEFVELVEAVRGRAAADVVQQAFESVDIGPVAGDLIATADALGDLTYVIYGMAILANIPLDDVIAEIHRSNLTKLGPDGRPVLRADGKVGKGPAFEEPDLARVLGVRRADAAGGLFPPGADPVAR